MGGIFVTEETVTNSDAKERTGEPKGILSPNLTMVKKSPCSLPSLAPWTANQFLLQSLKLVWLRQLADRYIRQI